MTGVDHFEERLVCQQAGFAGSVALSISPAG